VSARYQPCPPGCQCEYCEILRASRESRVVIRVEVPGPAEPWTPSLPLLAYSQGPSNIPVEPCPELRIRRKRLRTELLIAATAAIAIALAGLAIGLIAAID
jgi:hypothetical protein